MATLEHPQKQYFHMVLSNFPNINNVEIYNKHINKNKW